MSDVHSNIVKFPYSSSRRVHSKKAASVKEWHAGGASGEDCGIRGNTGRCCPHIGR
jgi:hypothetical protein